MVAYSFHKMFVPQVEGRTKRQTIRMPRKRHARPGESVQLFDAERTRKLIDPDPICTAVDEIRIEVGDVAILGIAINGIPLDDAAIELLAYEDGFGPGWHTPPGKSVPVGLRARDLMAAYWNAAHGMGTLGLVLIRWSDWP